MRPPKTDCIFEISIKKYVDYDKKIKNKNIDEINHSNDLSIYVITETIPYICINYKFTGFG